MPLLGNLCEFPLPEVLLLIGARTGRLRLLDVPEFGYLDIDFSSGEAQGMYLGPSTIIEGEEMIEKLSAIVQSKSGMFEFRTQPVATVQRAKALQVSQLVMLLVFFVDEQMAAQHRHEGPQHRYILAQPMPEIWIEPELDVFFHFVRTFLIAGVRVEELTAVTGLDEDTIRTNLTNLRLLGILRIVDTDNAAQVAELAMEEKISRKSNEFLRASRATSEIQRISSRLPTL